MDLTTLAISIITSNAISSFAQFLISRHDRKKDPEAQLLLGIGHDRIVYLCRKAIQRGYTTEGEVDNITGIYEPYTKMGGNGSGKKIYEQYIKLPLKEEKEDDK